MALLEVCCYSVSCAQVAEAAGADRIELCAAPKEGGITPSLSTLRQVSATVNIPVHPIVRPRDGDFCYSAGEFATLLDDIAVVRELGFPGVVTGVLDEDGNIDEPRMAQIMAAAGDMSVTFHRAFDMCREPLLALDLLGKLGVARVLTSGQQMNAVAGIELIRELISRTDTPIIMAGAGVRLSNLEVFLKAGVKELHSSAGHFTASPMRYRNPAVSMSGAADTDEYRRYSVDPHAVAAMKQAIQAFNC